MGGGCGGSRLRADEIAPGSGSLELGLKSSYLIVESLLFKSTTH